jgi:thiol-disulfide isomerase/thioredoxin
MTNKMTGVIIGGVAVFLLLTGSAIILIQGSRMDEGLASKIVDSNINGSETTAVSDDKDTGEEMKALPKEIKYTDYSDAKLANSQEDTVLFFHAKWCPTCNSLDDSIEEALQNGDYPDDLTVLKIDYDTNQELKERYMVNHQHTLVQVDDEGDSLKKWNGSLTLDHLESRLE